MPRSQTKSTIYFGYGSNLWKDQMVKRCPTSQYLGLARLHGYRWIINDRGYANVVEIKKKNPPGTSPHELEVWGLVYSLREADEANLDVNEGVPHCYTKEDLEVDFWPTCDHKAPRPKEQPEKMKMLVYIDRVRVEDDKPKKEYIYRMNMGIQDALIEGMPAGYMDMVMRKFIPDQDVDEEVAAFARKQAVVFEDEH